MLLTEECTFEWICYSSLVCSLDFIDSNPGGLDVYKSDVVTIMLPRHRFTLVRGSSADKSMIYCFVYNLLLSQPLNMVRMSQNPDSSSPDLCTSR